MKSLLASAILLSLSLPFLGACGDKAHAGLSANGDVPGASKLVCAYAPSQSKIVSHVAGTAGGAAMTAAAIAKAVGLTAVMHSSGAYIFTGSAGYIAGTLGGAAVVPIVVAVGVVAGGTAATIELLCVPNNHPDFAAKLKEAAQEFATRSKSNAERTRNGIAISSVAVTAELKNLIVTSGKEAFDYAYRKK